MSESLGRDGRVEQLYWEQLGTLIISKVESVCLFFFFFVANLMVSLSYKGSNLYYFSYFRERQANTLWVWQVTSKL